MVRLTVALSAASARGTQELLEALRFLELSTRLERGCLGCSAWIDPDSTVRHVEEWATEAGHAPARALGPVHLAPGRPGVRPRSPGAVRLRQGDARARLRGGSPPRGPDSRADKDEASEVRESAGQAAGAAVPSPAMGQREGAAGRHRARGARRCRQGRDDSRDHRAPQPARVQGRRLTCPVGPREEPDVHAALHAAFSRRPAKSSSSIGAGTTAPASST